MGHEGKHARGIIWKGWRILKMSLIVFARHDDDMFYDCYGNTILYLIIPHRNKQIIMCWVLNEVLGSFVKNGLFTR